MDEKEREKLLLTFLAWPKGMTQKPEELVAAGLKYTGKGDVCRCDHCGTTFYGWDANEIPLVKHAKVQPSCSFLSKLENQVLLKEMEKLSTQGESQQSSSSTQGNESLGATEMDQSTVKINYERLVPIATAEEENEVPFKFLCKVCWDKAIEVVYLPCAHAFACRECAFRLPQCAMCNSTAISFVQIYFPCDKCSPAPKDKSKNNTLV